MKMVRQESVAWSVCFVGMFANFRTIFDYDASPAQGKGSTDVKYILGVGWDF